MTWARQHFPEMQAGLARVYTEIAQEIGARVAPVGLAWEAALAADPLLALHTEDKEPPHAPRLLPGGVRLLRDVLRRKSRGPARETRDGGR